MTHLFHVIPHFQVTRRYVYCEYCKKAWANSSPQEHPNHEGDFLDFPGIALIRDFISDQEEQWLDQEINKTVWVNSQSGRRKQVQYIY